MNLNSILKLIGGFSIVGVLSTVMSLGLIFFVIKYLNWPLIPSYIGIYIVTILFSYVLNNFYVFKSKASSDNIVRYFLIYITGMLVGTFVLWIAKNTLPFENYILSYCILPITMSWNFILSYKLFKKSK